MSYDRRAVVVMVTDGTIRVERGTGYIAHSDGDLVVHDDGGAHLAIVARGQWVAAWCTPSADVAVSRTARG